MLSFNFSGLIVSRRPLASKVDGSPMMGITIHLRKRENQRPETLQALVTNVNIIDKLGSYPEEAKGLFVVGSGSMVTESSPVGSAWVNTYKAYVHYVEVRQLAGFETPVAKKEEEDYAGYLEKAAQEEGPSEDFLEDYDY